MPELGRVPSWILKQEMLGERNPKREKGRSQFKLVDPCIHLVGRMSQSSCNRFYGKEKKVWPQLLIKNYQSSLHLERGEGVSKASKNGAVAAVAAVAAGVRWLVWQGSLSFWEGSQTSTIDQQAGKGHTNPSGGLGVPLDLMWMGVWVLECPGRVSGAHLTVLFRLFSGAMPQSNGRTSEEGARTKRQ